MEPYIASISLNTGDIVVDLYTKESGILVRCINLFDSVITKKEDYPGINAWEILWTGSTIDVSIGRMQVYTEEGLINMIHEGRLQLYKNN